MLLSKTSEYALQALIYLAAQPEGEPVLSRDISDYLRVPAQYLAKILQDLAKRGVLDSFKGRGGGFVLRPGADQMNILDIVEVVEGQPFGQGCVLGLKACADETACPVHYQWKPLKAEVVGLLGKQTIGSMAEAVRAGRYRIHLPGGSELHIRPMATKHPVS
ncbi:RrF2 family transcriptional regulator [Acidithiobacillus sulfurivorans]|uniref:Rrf2 family transcriptional regulator n=1 Tax=Acidithiobacillus sulfurivorans TaxID=1958756 RepID=A0ABS6A0F1_9PROT|nr:Rrf2 family transcriptional regulator [Acidithiobacillus sulfurivorans]MBU2760621.1 Rrf2 family transcriptional regulator [Acidithiobacillus sulfurivorans]